MIDVSDMTTTDYIQCDPIGRPVHTDLNTKHHFYLECKINSIQVHVGDCVKVKLNSDDDDDHEVLNDDDKVGFGQILAIYKQPDEEVFAEIRWFWMKNELKPKLLKLYNTLNPVENELIATEELDDISIGAVSELINVKGSFNPSQDMIDESRLTYFQCRYLLLKSNTFQPLDMKTFFLQGISLSEYDCIYADETLNEINQMTNGLSKQNEGVNDEDTDPFSMAIKQLHISVIPDKLPCRQLEQETITETIKKCLVDGFGDKAIVITGMPGMTSSISINLSTGH